MNESQAAERPVLVREVIRSDGSCAPSLRVFCPSRDASVALDVCRACSACRDISADVFAPRARVLCGPGALTSGPPIRTSVGDGVAVGAILRANIVCVREDLDTARLPSLFVERGFSYVVVVNEDGVALGVVREADLLRSKRPGLSDARLVPGSEQARILEALASKMTPQGSVGEIMSSAAAIRESTPVRRALLQMAVSHVRDAPIVTADGVVLGLLKDVEGLRWLAGARDGIR